MSKILTAEGFLKEKFKQIYVKFSKSFTSRISEKSYLELHVNGRVNGIEQNYPEMMIEFAKLHVEACKKEYLQKGFGRYMNHPFDKNTTRIPIDDDSILNAYPLENIK